MTVILIIISSLILTIAFIESEKSQKIAHNTAMFIAESKTVKKCYYALIILLIIFGLLLSLFLAIIKISEGSFLIGIAGFMLVSLSILTFAFTSYKIAQ
jgi:nitric oxide reductase large subunit